MAVVLLGTTLESGSVVLASVIDSDTDHAMTIFRRTSLSWLETT